MTTVVKDPTHPDFPHGTTRGYYRGCSDECCREANRRANKRSRFRRQQYGPARHITEATSRRLQRHITALLEAVPRAGVNAIGRAAGLHADRITEALNGSTSLGHATAASILAVTVEQVTAQRAYVDCRDTLHRMGTMQALGYPARWQEEQMGARVGTLAAIQLRQSGTRAATHDAMAALAARVGDRPASEADGLTRGQINSALAAARRHGYYPPACYDENGNLDPRAVPGHPWAVADDLCHRNLDVLTELARPYGRLSISQIRQRYGIPDENFVTRLISKFGLRSTDPGCEDNRAALRKALTEYEVTGGDPVLMCFELGVYGTQTGVIPNDHPVKQEWLARIAAEKAAAKQAQPVRVAA